MADLLIAYSLPAVNIFVYFVTFLHCFSDTTKNILIASIYIHLKCNKFVKYASDLATASPRILLSGPPGKFSFVVDRSLINFVIH